MGAEDQAVGSGSRAGTQTLQCRQSGREVGCEAGEARMSWSPGCSPMPLGVQL